jgi:hypothetical protein
MATTMGCGSDLRRVIHQCVRMINCGLTGLGVAPMGPPHHSTRTPSPTLDSYWTFFHDIWSLVLASDATFWIFGFWTHHTPVGRRSRILSISSSTLLSGQHHILNDGVRLLQEIRRCFPGIRLASPPHIYLREDSASHRRLTSIFGPSNTSFLIVRLLPRYRVFGL